MFVLVVIEDKIKIIPEKFDTDNTEVILDEIDEKFINKVSNNYSKVKIIRQMRLNSFSHSPSTYELYWLIYYFIVLLIDYIFRY